MADNPDDILDFLDLDSEPVQPSKVQRQEQHVVQQEQRVEAAASKQEIDSRLDSLTKQTTLEELAKRRGKTKKVKTLSERKLKQWINEALTTVISSSTSIDSEEAERLLANTQGELKAIMKEREAEASNRAAEQQKLSEMTTQYQSMSRRIAELEQQILDKDAENERLADQIQDLDADLASKEYSSSNEVINALRQELQATKDKHAISLDEQNQLRKNLGKQLVASTEVVTALLAIDQRYYNGSHQPQTEGETEQSDEFFADQNAAAAVASNLQEDLEFIHNEVTTKVSGVAEGEAGTLAADKERIGQLIWKQEHKEKVAELEAELRKAQEASAEDNTADLQAEIDELRNSLDEAEITAEAYEARVGELSESEAALQKELEELRQQPSTDPLDAEALSLAQNKAQELSEEVDKLRKELDQDKRDNIILQGTLTSLRRQLERAQEQLGEQQASDEAKNSAELASLQNKLDAAEKEIAELRSQLDALNGLKQRVAELEAELADKQQSLEEQKAAFDAQSQQDSAQLEHLRGEIARLQSELDAAKNKLADTENTEQAELQAALARARSMVTTSEGNVYEDLCGPLVPRKPGMWLSAWRDPKGRLKTGRTVGDRWVGVGRNKDFTLPSNLFGEPNVLCRGDHALVCYRDNDGHASSVMLDSAGKVISEPTNLGPSLGTPAISRGGGEAPPFIVTTDPSGHIHLFEEGSEESINVHKVMDHIPLAVGPATAWHWGLEGSRHIAYRGGDGAIHELLDLDGTWYHANLTQHTDAPPAAGDPQGYAPADHEHVIYIGTDGHINELCFDHKEWKHHDLTVATGGPAASGIPHGAYVNGRHHIAYAGVDSKINLLRLRRDWRAFAMNSIGEVHGDVFLSSCGNEGAIMYTDQGDKRQWARFAEDPAELTIEELP